MALVARDSVCAYRRRFLWRRGYYVLESHLHAWQCTSWVRQRATACPTRHWAVSPLLARSASPTRPTRQRALAADIEREVWILCPKAGRQLLGRERTQVVSVKARAAAGRVAKHHRRGHSEEARIVRIGACRSHPVLHKAERVRWLCWPTVEARMRKRVRQCRIQKARGYLESGLRKVRDGGRWLRREHRGSRRSERRRGTGSWGG